MKALQQIRYILPLIFLLACTGSSNRLAIGSGFYGKNKVIKTQDAENLTVRPDNHPSLNITRYAELNALEDTLKSVGNEDYINESTDPVTAELEEQSEKLKGKIKDVKSSIKHSTEAFSPIQSKKAPLNDVDNGDAATVAIVVLLIYILGILLVILLFYLLIKAINNAANNAADEGCYVATMTYGSYDHPKVITLRRFRDEFLAKRKWGQNFIKWYYRNSPSFVSVYRNNKFVNAYLRMHLNVFIFLIKPFFRK